MAATILQWNARGLRCNRRDFDILIGEHQPDVICLQETKLEHSPPLSHYRCANYDGYCKSQRRNPDQLPCGGVLIYIKKGLYHRVIQVDSHLQAIAVQVTLGGTPITITRDLYAPRPNGRGGMTRPTAAPIGLKVEEAMTSAEINAELVCPLRTPNFPPGTHDYDPKRHDLIEGVSKCMISGQEAQAKFNEFREAQGSHDEVYTDGSKMNERVGAAAVINRHFQNGETTCRQLSKRLPDNSTIFAAEATAISLALNYYQHMGPVHHDVVVYSDSMSCLQAIEGEDTENPFICHIMNLLWSLSDKGTRVRFCWVPSHCGINGNERVDPLAKETLDQDIDALASVHYTDMKPLVNSYIQKLVQTKWDVAVHGRGLYLVKPTLGPPKKFQHLTRAEEVVITRLRIGHTKATKSHILSRGPPTGCHYCGQTLTIDHMLLECALLQECRDEYYTVDSLNTLFETIPETCIVEFLREAGFFYLIWCNLLTSTSPQYDQTWVIV